MEIISYQGIFLDKESIKKLVEMQEEKLTNVVMEMHCTFKYRPEKKETESFLNKLGNKAIFLKIVGYASDGKNSGFEVELTDEQREVYFNTHIIDDNTNKTEMTIPHITVSLSDNAKAVNTRNLKFKRLKEPFYISGRAGVCIVDKETNCKKYET